MQFSNTTTLDGIVQEIDRLCGTDSNTYAVKDKTARVNQALDRFIYLALKNDGVWNFDDLNHTDLPVGTSSLVSGQQDYEFDDEVLAVLKVLAKDSNGTWKELEPVNMNDPDGEKIWTLPTSNSGSPLRYQLFGHSILLDPIPNYASTGGLKVVYKRKADKFESTDTTAEPGIPSPFHPYLCRYAALPYCIEKNLPQAQGIASLVQQDEQAIADYFLVRNRDLKHTMKPKVEDCH